MDGMQPVAAPQATAIVAPDGYVLRGQVWRHRDAGGARRPVVIVNAATSVRCGYYARFAAFLHRHGHDVVIYDYRGIGESRPASLRGFLGGWLDWGRLDVEAALRYAMHDFPGQPIQVVAHSVGGLLIGLAPSSHRIERIFTMGAQYAYWRDYAEGKRLGMLVKWHGIMPLLTALCGYFPGKRLGWLEDTPREVVQDWIAPHARFEGAYRTGARTLLSESRAALAEGFAAVHAPTLAVGVTDDEFGTVAAIQRLLAYYRNSPSLHLHLPPAWAASERIGHFAFFHGRFEPTLWQIALDWLMARPLRDDLRALLVPPYHQSAMAAASSLIHSTTAATSAREEASAPISQ